MEKLKNGNVLTNSILSRLIRDEATVVRLIKQDILISLLLNDTGIFEFRADVTNKLEINRIVWDLLLLDRSKNKDQVIDFYDKIIEESSKLIKDSPEISIDEVALNCFVEVKRIIKW